MNNYLKKELAEFIYSIIKTNHQTSASELKKQLRTPPSQSQADYALGCFLLAKNIQKKPFEVAQELEVMLQKNCSFFKVQSSGPYLNFTFDEGFLLEKLDKISESFSSSLKEKKVLIEYSQPNTHKELHVGHMRNLCLGKALSNLLKIQGHNVIDITYPGDHGTHVAKCLWYLKKKGLSPQGVENKGTWLGKIYSLAHRKLEEELGGPHEKQNRQELTEIIRQIECLEGEYFDLWKKTREWSLNLMRDTYSWCGIDFDYWYYESELNDDSLELVSEYYEKGVFEKDEGAIGINLRKYNEQLGFLILKKSNGQGLYATKDLLLAQKKMEQFTPDESFYVVDKRQSLHFKQVFKTLEVMDILEVERCHHIAYDFVELPTGAMSSRAGNIIPLETLIKNMEAHITKTYLEDKNWSLEQKKKLAQDIAKGAIFYGMLSVDPQKKIVFDLEEWLRLDGNSGPYLQYTLARLKSVLNKVGVGFSEGEVTSTEELENCEHEIIVKMAEKNEVIKAAAEAHSPAFVANYLYQLAQLTNSFYALCPIIKASTAVKARRINILKSLERVFTEGFALLYIPAIEKM